MDVAVEYHTIDGTPVPECFSIKGRVVRVTEILDRWLGRDHGYFKVRGDDGGTYILRHELNDRSWSLTFFVANEQQWPKTDSITPALSSTSEPQ